MRANVAEWSDCQAMVATAVDTFGALHVLYNNAGIFPADDGGVLDTPQETWRRVMAVNLEGVWLGCKAGIPAMLESGGGAIVNVASFVALMGAATAQIAYTASKGGVLAMTREIAVEYAAPGHPRQRALPRARSRRRCSRSSCPTPSAGPGAWCTSRWAGSGAPRSSPRPRCSSRPTTRRS